MAKLANIYSYKVLDKTLSVSLSTLLVGLQNLLATQFIRPGYTVINMSMTMPYSLTLNDALANYYAAGAVVVVAAGNGGVDACTQSPASAGSSVFTIGASSYDDSMASFSNYGTCLDIFAPGIF